MLRRFRPSPPTVTTAVVAARFCSSNTSAQQKNTSVPPVLKQFDQHMRTVPAWRALYPQLLGAIVNKSREDAAGIVSEMIDALGGENDVVDEKEKTKPEDEAVIDEEKAKEIDRISLVIVDIAYADMFYDAAAEREAEDSAVAATGTEQEAADESILQLFLEHLGGDFKLQKARIAKFVVETLQKERDSVIEERGLVPLKKKKSNDARKNSSGDENNKNKISRLPNIALMVTPPMDADSKLTAKQLLARIREEFAELESHPAFKQTTESKTTTKAHLLKSICERLVFAGAVLDSDREQVDKLTELLASKQKKVEAASTTHSLISDKQRRFACRAAVETDTAIQRRGEEEESGETSFIRLDFGVEEVGLVSALGLDKYQHREKDGEEVMIDVANDISRRTWRKLNDHKLFAETPILPFSFTMRCRVV